MKHNGHSICFEWPFFVGSISGSNDVSDERMPHRFLCVVFSAFCIRNGASNGCREQGPLQPTALAVGKADLGSGMLRGCFFQAIYVAVVPQASGQADQGYETHQSKDELVSQSSRIVVDQETSKGSEEHIGKKPD